MLSIDGDWLSNERRTQLSNVKYSVRYALAVYYGDIDNEVIDLDFRAKYVYDCDVIRYISIENLKKDTSKDSCSNGLAILIHTTVPIAEQWIANNLSEQDITNIIISKLSIHLPMVKGKKISETFLKLW